ncbi:MAG: type II toxin-antitoxin system Phd/YefM family antitoxin [Syntrophomonadaceae bacterium]|nr:type II toxin-antitoxin system Phd/YefM family antitoxin [Syntrophomonadaceae bacterium]
MLNVNVGDAKKKFLELVRQVEEHQSIVIKKKGEPVAAILPYSEYISLNRIKSYIALQELANTLKDSGITAKEVYTASKAELERSE